MPRIRYDIVNRIHHTDKEEDKMWKCAPGKRLTASLLAGLIAMSMMTGCASDQSAAEDEILPVTEETAGEASTEASSENAAAVEAELLSKDELEALGDSTKPYDGEMQVVLHSLSGEETVLYSPSDNKEAVAALSAMAGKGRSWLKVKKANATTTLRIKGYNYSVWNMLDWDTRTCWAEGDARSEGLYEGFTYYFSGKTRIDGFRIYPGYQKNKRVYRNNIYPRGMILYGGGYEIDCDFDPGIQNIRNDGDYYWIDITFSKPIYDSKISTMIIAVGTYGSDPDSDCCITEFHPFRYK